MKFALLLLALLFALMVASILLAPAAYGCTCTNLGWAASQHLEQADYAFVGQAISITTFSEHHEIVFTVSGCWKGVMDGQITIRTNIDDGVCGYNFTAFEHYVVFAGEAGEIPQTGSCSGNAGVVAGTMEYGDLPTAGDPGDCEVTPVERFTWSGIKLLHP